MKNVVKKSISCFLILCLSMSCCLISFASENQTTKEIQNEYVYDNLPDPFNSNVEFAEIEKGILDYINTSNLEIEIGSEEYVDLMYSILYGQINNISDVTERYFYDYASVYVVEAQRILAVENTRRKDNENRILDITLSGTIETEKQKNSEAMSKMRQTAEERIVAKSAYFNLSRAQAYAQQYALSWNYVYGRYSSDCTNFASQILHYAGMPEVSGAWQWNGNELAKRRWNVAHDFMEYFGAERGYAYGGYTTRSQTNANARPGDFLGYMANDTYAIWHVCFVQSKVNGEIYISQHTTDRYNEKWNNISIHRLSTYCINRF